MQPKRFFFLLFLTSQAAMCQTPDSARVAGLPPKADAKFSFVSELGFSLAATSTPNMHAYFRQNQIEYSAFRDPFVHVNAGGRYQRLKLLVHIGYGVDFVVRKEQTAPVARRNHARYSGATLGYDVLNSRNERLYLNAGVGGISYEYGVYGRTSQPVPFQTLPQYSQPGSLSSLTLDNTYWDFNIEFSQREKRKASLSRVLRLGYRRGWQPRAWESGAFPLTGAPTDRISQFYFSASLYFSKNYAKITN